MITETLRKYHELSTQDTNHRFKSWEHCYNFFSQNHHNLKDENNFDHASLHLAFYLASWGMLRSSFLLQKDYKIHSFFIKNVVMNPDHAFHFNNNDLQIDGMDKLIEDTRKAYQDNIREVNGERVTIKVTDTLASKILLGVYGNVPAYDRYFVKALQLFGIRTQFNEKGLRELKDFYEHNIDEFEASRKLFSEDGVHYTPMKLIDMFFWQIGFMMDDLGRNIDELQEITDFAKNYKATEKVIKPPKEPVKQASTDEIREYIISILNTARASGEEYVDLKSGDIHSAMELEQRMPSVCSAMETLGVFESKIINDTPSGKSSTKVIRYYLNREKSIKL